MKIKIKVVDYEGEKLFITGKTLFDTLQAEYFFDGGELIVERQGKVIAKTTGIYEYGTHASFMVFQGLAGDWMKSDWKSRDIVRGYLEKLYPEDFEVGDKIVVRYKTLQNFVDEIKYIFKGYTTFRQIRYIFSKFLKKEDFVGQLQYNYIAAIHLRGIFEKRGPGVSLDVIGKDLYETYWNCLDEIKAMKVLRFREINEKD